MLCQKPFVQGAQSYRCGQCLPCRIYRRRVWVTRLYFEAQQFGHNVFLTLTYSEEKVPADGSLQKVHYQNFLKRLRFSIGGRRVSYYIVGEYGAGGGRPHYHCVLFNYGENLRPGLICEQSFRASTDEEKELFCLWGHGNVHVGAVTEASLQYACKHLTKGLKNDLTFVACDLVPPRVPEFARMSLRPPIGLCALDAFESAFQSTAKGALSLFCLGGDAPSGVRIENQVLPIGKYLRSRLRDRLGLDERTARASRKALALERHELNVVLGPRKLKELREVDGNKAIFAAERQRLRRKL